MTWQNDLGKAVSCSCDCFHFHVLLVSAVCPRAVWMSAGVWVRGSPRQECVTCTSVLRSPGMQGAHSSLPFVSPVFREGQLLLLPALAELWNCKGCWVLWFRLGTWSCPFQVAWERVWSFPLMYTQTYPMLPPTQTPASACLGASRLQLGVRSMLKIQCWSVLKVCYSKWQSTWVEFSSEKSLAPCLRMEILLIKGQLQFLITL